MKGQINLKQLKARIANKPSILNPLKATAGLPAGVCVDDSDLRCKKIPFVMVSYLLLRGSVVQRKCGLLIQIPNLLHCYEIY